MTTKGEYDYDPYGRQTKIARTGPDADFGYAGYYQHSRSGLNLTMFRAYGPSLGRWLSRDPLGESAGTNLYAYVSNNPISGVDPLGLEGGSIILFPHQYFRQPGPRSMGPISPLDAAFSSLSANLEALASTMEARYLAATAQVARMTIAGGAGTACRTGRVGLDTNAIIARLEGAPADVQAVINAMGGRSPSLSRTAIKEYLRRGNVNDLRTFMTSTGGQVGPAASPATIQSLQAAGLAGADARVAGSALDQGIEVLTRDQRMLNRAPNAVRF